MEPMAGQRKFTVEYETKRWPKKSEMLAELLMWSAVEIFQRPRSSDFVLCARFNVADNSAAFRAAWAHPGGIGY